MADRGMVGWGGRRSDVARPGQARALGAVVLLAGLAALAGCAPGPVGTRTWDWGCCPEPCAPAPCPPPQACPPVLAQDCGPPPPCAPAQAKAGEAWCQVWIPPVTQSVTEQVCVKPASTRRQWIPPQYGYRPQVVCVAPAKLEHTVRPAVYATKKREYEVCPPRERWCRADCPQVTLAPGERQCDCWVKVVQPPVVTQEDCVVCLSPERRCVQYSPARYEVVQERYLIEPGRCEEFCEPAQYEMRCREVVVCPGRWEWRRNETCEPPPALLGGIQTKLSDLDVQGRPQGIFGVGDTVRYELVVSNDGGEGAMTGLRARFTLPQQLEFVSGAGDVSVQGAGNAAQTAPFDLPLGASARISVLARVVAPSPTHMIQFTAEVVGTDGEPLAIATESTTIRPGRGEDLQPRN